jgi:hypothetical protein
MSESLYRRNPKEGNPIKILQARRGLLDKQQTLTGKSASVRNPCYVSITGYDKSCGGSGKMELPRFKDDMQGTYYQGGSIKPGPDLISVSLSYGGDWGLARKLSATIKCYKMSDFEDVQKNFLLPGNEIDVSFGYNSNVTWGIAQSAKLSKFKVATFNFNTDQDGSWLCSFEAVSASTAIKNLDIQIVICNGCDPVGGTGQSGTSGPIKYQTGIESTTHAVKGIAELIAGDSQVNGTYSIDKMRDGEVVTSFVNFNPGTNGKEAACVIYWGDHLRGIMDSAMAWITGALKSLGIGKSEVEASNNQVYVTLGYVVHRIIDDQLLRAMTCGIAHERDDFNKLKVEFHPEYSKCKVASGITSGDPTTVLLLGDGNYMNSEGEGKDFDADCKNLAAVKAISGTDVKLQNILIHRDVVIGAFNEATKKRESKADNTDVKDTGEEVVNVITFFEKIADHISASVGGAIALRLVEHPTESNILIVVDQNYGVTGDLQCVVFDPIDGDGSTRSCTVQSNVGSQEYRAAMFVGSNKKGDAISALRGCSPKLDSQRGVELGKAQTDKQALIKSPGNLGKNAFNGEQINALKSIMGRIHKNSQDAPEIETIHYPGLSISVELDGVYGFTPGNAISSTQIPKKWRNQYKSYFMIVKTTHDFNQSDWVTRLDGILGYYPNINYVNL